MKVAPLPTFGTEFVRSNSVRLLSSLGTWSTEYSIVSLKEALIEPCFWNLVLKVMGCHPLLSLEGAGAGASLLPMGETGLPPAEK
jgi:hypothetical protein